MSGQVESIFRQVIVEASQERCFRVFTEQLDAWWPRSHHIGKSPLKKTEFETRLGGLWVSTSEDGSRDTIGRIVAWEPPARFVVTWEIDGDWKCDPSFVTHVEVNFISEGPKRTRVTIEHRDLHRYGVKREAFTTSIGGPGGWQGLLERFAKQALLE